MGEEAAVRKAGRGQRKGLPPSKGCFLPGSYATESSHRQLKGSFVWGQERNEKAEAVMGKGEDRTDSKHLPRS